MAKGKRQIKARGQGQTLQSRPAETGNRSTQRRPKPQDEMLKKHGDKSRQIAD